MVVLLVVLTLLLFLLVDWLTRRKGLEALENPAEASGMTRPIALSEAIYVGGFRMQREMAFHPGHGWALIESPLRARVGIDDFAAKLVGKIDDIELPKVGDRVVQGQTAWVLHHKGREAPMLSPVSGEVVAINPRIEQDKGIIQSDPFSEGWLFSVHSQDLRVDFNNLLRGDLPRKWLELISAHLRVRLHGGLTLSLPDGGVAMEGLCSDIDEERWKEVIQEFLLTEA